MTYLFVGHRPDSLASGRPLAFGDRVSPEEAEAAENERLTRDALLVFEPDPSPVVPEQPKGRAAAPQSTPSEEE